MAFKVIQGHQGRYQSKAVCNFLLVINSITDILSRTVSELSQLIVQILDTAFLSPLWGLMDNVRCSSWAHWRGRSGLPITFFR